MLVRQAKCDEMQSDRDCILLGEVWSLKCPRCLPASTVLNGYELNVAVFPVSQRKVKIQRDLELSVYLMCVSDLNFLNFSLNFFLKKMSSGWI